jgi:hypothetical protein
MLALIASLLNMPLSPDKKDYTFRSFWDREDCFRVLTAFLNKYRGITTEVPQSSKGRQRANTATTAPTESTEGGSPPASNHGVDEATASNRHQSMPLLRKNRHLPAVPPSPASSASSATSNAGNIQPCCSRSCDFPPISKTPVGAA